MGYVQIVFILNLIVFLAQFQAIKGALDGGQILLATAEILDKRIFTKFLVVVDIFIALDNAEYSLGE